MERIGRSGKQLRRVDALVRVKSKELKMVDAASLLPPHCQVPRNGAGSTGRCNTICYKSFL